MLITTSYDPQPEQLQAALELSEKLQLLQSLQTAARFIERMQFSIPQLRKRYSDSDILLVSRDRIEYHQDHQPVLFFHPSTAAIRIKRLIKGEQDSLIELSAIQPGDRVLDCTAGLGSDALVYSFATQGNGQVTALESQVIPYLILKEGLRTYNSDIPGMNEAMRRIEVVQADHSDYLQQQPDNSYDIVYLDPMFRQPIHESSSMSAIRLLADPRPISESTIKEARRVAKRVILLKEHRDSGEFARLGFETARRSTTKIAYGVIRL